MSTESRNIRRRFQYTSFDGTNKNIVSHCAEKVKLTLELIRQKLSERSLVHYDETGTNIDGNLYWVQNVSSGSYTYMTVSKERRYEGVKSTEILTDYRGLIVYDCWKFDNASHSVCCAHLLRELNGVIENNPGQAWADKFKKLLLRMKKANEKAIAARKEILSVFKIQKNRREFDIKIGEDYTQNPVANSAEKRRSRVKHRRILSLINKLKKDKVAVCLFLETLGSVRQQSSRA